MTDKIEKNANNTSKISNKSTSSIDTAATVKNQSKKPVFSGLRYDENDSKRILGYLPSTPGKEKSRKGRGTGSGIGNFSTRGCKGQGQRGSAKIGFEGGQTPWYKRVPKRGFTSRAENGLNQQMSVPLDRIINLMNKNNLNNVSSEDILKICNAPFYFKSVKIIGTVENIPTTIEIQCEAMSAGAEESLKENNSTFKKIEKTRTHSVRKKVY